MNKNNDVNYYFYKNRNIVHEDYKPVYYIIMSLNVCNSIFVLF